MQFLARYIMHGRVQAIGAMVALAILSFIVSPLAVFTTAGVALVTLVHGYREGLLSLVVSTIILAIFTGLVLKQPYLAIEVALKFWLPAWILANVVLSRKSMSTAIVVAAAVCLLLISVFYSLGEPANYWMDIIKNQLVPMMKEAGMQFKADEKTEKLWLFMSRVMTGSVLAVFFMMQIMSLLLARYWQALLYNKGGFGQEFRDIRFGTVIAGISMLIVLLAIVTGSELALNLFLVVIALMLIQGLAVAHKLVHQCQLNGTWLVGLYIFIVFTLQFQALGLFVVAMLGLLDNWLNFRGRFCVQKTREDQE